MRNDDAHIGEKTVEDLFREHYKVLRAYAHRLSGDRDMAEDIVQDVFFRLWNRKDELIMGKEIKHYLFRSVYTTALNRLGSKEYTNRESLLQTTESRIERAYLQSQSDYPEDNSIDDDVKAQIQTLIDSLPRQCRNVFLLSRKNELTNRQVAWQLGISVKAVEKHISKALYFLRSGMKK